jgi:hypothetical protein
MSAARAVVMALLIAAALAWLPTVPAIAAEEPGHDIDPEMRGSIVVDGPVQPGTIDVRRVDDIDLSEPSAWSDVQRLTAEDALADHPLTAHDVTSVDSEGDLTFGRLPIGVYVIVRAGTRPALVTIPWRVDGSWTDQVRVFPKAPPLPHTEPPRQTGHLRVVKVDEDDRTRTLAGAQFEVRPVVRQGSVRSAPLTDPGTGDTRFRTGADGAFEVELEPGEYDLVEVVAPTGYRLVGDPIRVEIVAGGSDDAVVEIVGNPRLGAVTLALTGADVWVPILVAAGLLLGGVALMQWRQRRGRDVERRDDRP